ncbi:MAG: prepilin-type N-terminal cleavage/methylation domain-containing protein [Pseudomonadota bacterium]
MTGPLPGRRAPLRRRRHERGFSMVEAVVALMISALTLALLSGAAFSLRAIGMRSASEGAAVEMLAARRVLRRFASETVLRGAGNTAGFSGRPQEVRLLLAPDLSTGAPARLAVLRVEQVDGRFLLAAYRKAPAGSVLTDLDVTRADRSEVLQSDTPIGFAYLVDNPEGPGTRWVAEHEPGPPPHALAVDLAGGQRLTATFAQEMDPGCLAARGVGQMERNRCLAR